MAPTSAWERRQGDSRTRREAATSLLNRHRQSRGRKSAHEKSSAGGRKLATLCLHSPGRAEYILWARVSQGAPGLVMLSSTCSYISAVTLLLQCTSGNAVLAQEGQATTATASAKRSRRRVRAIHREGRQPLHDTRVEQFAQARRRLDRYRSKKWNIVRNAR
jgi:hypothetical protein